MSTRISPRARAPFALLLVAFLTVPALAPSARAAIIEEIVAKVNNRIVSKSEFEERSTYILRQIYQEYSGAELDARMKDARETMLANMITELLLVERAETLLDLDKVRKNLVDDFRKQQSIASDADLEKLLKEQGMSRRDLEEQLIRMAVPGEVISYEVRRKISVSDAEIKDYYDRHQKQWETPASVTFNEIVLFYENANKPEVDSRARGIVREARGGTDFAELVQKYSESPSKETGGFLGPLSVEDLHPAISDSVFSLKPDEVGDPIDTGHALHVIRLVSRTDRVVKTPEEVKDLIVRGVREEKFRPRYERYIRKLWRESQVEILPKYEHFLIWSPIQDAKTREEKLPSGAPGATPEELQAAPAPSAEPGPATAEPAPAGTPAPEGP